MLKFFSRLEKTRNLVIVLFAILLIAGMVLFYAPQQGGVGANLAYSNETAASVGSGVVTVGDIATEKENTSRMYGGRMPVQTKQILERLISSRLTSQEAARLGFYASDEELKERILEENKTPDGKPFDLKKYEQRITEAFGSVAKYEQSVRDQIAVAKLYAFITSGVSVSEEEVLSDYKKQNTKFNVSYVTISATELAKTIKPSEDELKGYFEEHKKDFFISQTQKKIKYIFINQAKSGEKLPLTEEDMRAEYDNLQADKKREGVHVQQIVLKVPKPDQDEEIMQKANDLVSQIRAKGVNGVVTEEAFAEVAQGNSQDPSTAGNGGRLPVLIKESKDSNDPRQQTLSMTVGSISEPIKFAGSYYIFRRGEEVAKKYEDAKQVIQISLRNRRAYTAAAELAQKVSDRLKEVKDVDKVAAEFATQANMNVKDMVRETDFIKKDDEVPNIGVSPQFEEGIAGLENVGDVGGKVPIREGFSVPMLVDKKEPREATFDEVKTDVENVYKAEQARTKMDQIAKEIAEGATSLDSLKSLAESKGLKVQESKDYRVGSPLGTGIDSGSSEELSDVVFALQVGQVSKTPVKIGDAWFIVGANERLEADMNEFAKQRDQLVEQSLGMKRNQVFSDFTSDARRRYETEGRIKIYDAAIQKLENAPKDEDA